MGPYGPTNKFQAEWLEHPAPEGQPQRKDWLSDGGVDERNRYQACCSICPATFQCRKQAIAAHEISNSHKDKEAAWLTKQQVLVGWQGQKTRVQTTQQFSAQHRQPTPSCTPSLHACSRRCSRGASSLTCVQRRTLKYIRNPQRNRLHPQHLTSCARGFKSSAFSVEPFPYSQAILEWLSAKKRRGIKKMNNSVRMDSLQFQTNFLIFKQLLPHT